MVYNAIGNILFKTDVGTFDYAPSGNNGAGVSNPRPHAVASLAGGTSISYGYDANGNVTSASAGKYSSVSYTSFNLPDNNNGAQGPSGGPQYLWQYDENHQRIKETHVSGGVTRTSPSGLVAPAPDVVGWFQEH